MEQSISLVSEVGEGIGTGKDSWHACGILGDIRGDGRFDNRADEVAGLDVVVLHGILERRILNDNIARGFDEDANAIIGAVVVVETAGGREIWNGGKFESGAIGYVADSES